MSPIRILVGVNKIDARNFLLTQMYQSIYHFIYPSQNIIGSSVLYGIRMRNLFAKNGSYEWGYICYICFRSCRSILYKVSILSRLLYFKKSYLINRVTIIIFLYFCKENFDPPKLQSLEINFYIYWMIHKTINN